MRIFGLAGKNSLQSHAMAIEENHSIHWDPLAIEKEGHVVKRKVKEALWIREVKTKGQMNQDRNLQLSKFWLDLVG